MTYPSAIVFDLFATLINDRRFNFVDGLVYLHTEVLDHPGDLIDFLAYADTNWKTKYDARDKDHHEINFTDELIDFKLKFGFRVDLSLDEIQFRVLKAMNDLDVFDDTVEVLEKIKEKRIPIYLLSNAIFNRRVMARFLDSLGILPYFNEIFFSADYGVRKPHQGFFAPLVEHIQKRMPDVDLENVWFIGDNYLADVIGATQAGLTPIWINRKYDSSRNVLKVKEISSLSDIVTMIATH